MALLRPRRRYPREMLSASFQKDLNKFLRVGTIESLDVNEGTCSVSWLDLPGVREDVLLTQGVDKEWHVPEIGSVVIVGFDVKQQPRILRYINLGQATRAKEMSLPKLKAGEKLWEVGGSYLYMQKNGNVSIATLSQGTVTLDNISGTFRVETISAKTITEAGAEYFGVVRRVKANTDGSKAQQLILDANNNSYTEYHLQVIEKADNQLGVTGLNDPIVDITFGTVINSDGDIVDKKDGITVATAHPTKQIAVRLKAKSGVQIDIDKEGRVSIKNAKVNLNQGSVDSSDADIALGLEANNATLGTKGQHAAREHDAVTIPVSQTYTDAQHAGLPSKGVSNLSGMSSIASAIMSPQGLCFLLPGRLQGGVKLEGEITEGATNVIVGDN